MIFSRKTPEPEQRSDLNAPEIPVLTGEQNAPASNISLPDGWLDSDRVVRRLGYCVVAILAAVLGIWASFAPLESAALAPGLVRVEGDRKAVQHLEGGIVSRIIVASGDSVRADQPLLLLDATRDRAELQILQGRLYNKQALVNRLIAERDDQLYVVYDAILAERSVDDERARNAMANEDAIFVARLADRRGDVSVLQQRVKQYQQQINGLESLAATRTSVAESMAIEISDLEELLSEGYVDKQRLRELERRRTQTLGELYDLRAQVAAADVGVAETELSILQLSKRFKTEVVDQLTEAQERLYSLRQQLTATQDRVQRATVRATTDGIVLNLAVNTVGAVIKPGDTLMEIVPQTDNLVIEAQLSPMDVDRVRIGQEAEIRFAVFKDAYTVTGKLTKLSPDSIVNPDTNIPYFAVEIKILVEDSKVLDGLTLLPGMPAEVIIKTGERTMLGYLTSPMNRLFARSLIED